MGNCGSGCGCNNQPYTPCGCLNLDNSAQVGVSLIIQSSWNVPAVGAEAEVDVVGLKSIMVGSNIFAPTYGTFKITSFSLSRQSITILNEGYGVALAGTVVPANTSFGIANPIITKEGAWSPVFLVASGMTTTLGTLDDADYWAQRDLVHFKFQASLVLTGTASNTIALVAPIIPFKTKSSFIGTYFDGTIYGPIKGDLIDPTTVGQPAGVPILAIKKRDGSNFTIGNISVSMNGFYKSASYTL